MITLSLVDVLIFMGFVSFGSAVQIPGIGGGMQVVAVLVLTELFGVRLELATSFAICHLDSYVCSNCADWTYRRV